MKRCGRNLTTLSAMAIIGVARGAMGPLKSFENIVILCFERRFSKQNSVIRLKSNILPPPNIWSGYGTVTILKQFNETPRINVVSRLS